MRGRVDGKVAFITGAARGLGRSHALRLAGEGADIIAVDVCSPITGVMPFGPTEADLAETAHAVKAFGRRIVAAKADVRDYEGLKTIVDNGIAQLGRLDIVCVNAGISPPGEASHLISDEVWRAVTEINQTGAWHTCKAAMPHLIDQGHGGSIVITGSAVALRVPPNCAPYVASKQAIVGLMRALAVELAPHLIRVNVVHPTSVPTELLLRDENYKLFRPDLENPTVDDFAEVLRGLHALRVPWVEPVDVSNAVLFLASDEARYVTGSEIKVDAGWAVKFP